jgi:hypothetical protein
MALPSRSAAWVAALCAAMPVMYACESAVAPAASVELVRLAVGDQTVLVDRAEGPRSSVSIPLGTEEARTAVTFATFHRQDGTEVELDAAFYEARIVPAEPSVVFYWRAESFQGRLVRLMAGQTQVTFSIVNILSGEVEFGPHNLTIN